MEAAVKRITSPAFWRTGVVVGVALITLLGIQAYNWVQAGDVAMAATMAETRELYPAESWAFDMRERCRHGQGEFADTRVALMADCDRMVLKEAREQGKEQAVSQALSAQNDAMHVALKTVSPAWPLSVFHQPMWRLAVWLLK